MFCVFWKKNIGADKIDSWLKLDRDNVSGWLTLISFLLAEETITRPVLEQLMNLIGDKDCRSNTHLRHKILDVLTH